MASVATRIKAREVEASVHLPYLRHVTEHVISLSTRALITTIRLSGVSFETADAADLNDLHDEAQSDAAQHRRRTAGAVDACHRAAAQAIIRMAPFARISRANSMTPIGRGSFPRRSIATNST